MKLILVCLSCLALQGCWFFMMPLPSSDPSSAANICVPDGYAIGKRLKNEKGQIGTVTAIHGRHHRCQNGAYPILATVEYE
jgi:hypothetical protein